MTKKPQTAKKTAKAKAPKTPKPDKTEKRVEAARAAIGANSADPQMTALFEHHIKKIAPLKARITSQTGDLRALYKTAKADGFTKDQFDLAIQLATPEGVEKFKEKMNRQTLTLMYTASPLTGQFELFSGAPAPSEDESLKVAYEAGVNDSKAENPAKTKDYAPGSKQMEEYLRGFHDHGTSKLAGMKTLETEPPAVPTSGQPMTRQQYRDQQAQLKGDGGGTAH